MVSDLFFFFSNPSLNMEIELELLLLFCIISLARQTDYRKRINKTIYWGEFLFLKVSRALLRMEAQ